MRFLVAVLLGVAAAVSASASDRLQVGGSAGLGFEREMFGSGDPIGFRLASGEIAFGATLVRRHGYPRMQVVNSLLAAQSFGPESRFVHGGVFTMRVYFRPQLPIGFYTEGGAGVTSSALRIEKLNGRMQYYLLFGGGIRFRKGARTDILLGCRWSHLSNNGTSLPNRGINMITPVVSLMYTLP